MRGPGVLLSVVVLAAACGGDDSSVAQDSDATGSGDTEQVDFCPGVEHSPPEVLPTGQVIELVNDGADHVVCPTYEHSPPASGSHFPAWQNCGVYSVPIQDQIAVHSLEHGAVWVTYQPDLDPGVVEEIGERLGRESHALGSPYPGLANPIVLTAWTRQLAVDDWSDPAVEEFLGTFVGGPSPVAAEAGASCDGAIGSAPTQPNADYENILDQVG
jgi:Protein of unknown function (DUF3105)